MFALADKDVIKSLKDAHDRNVDVKVLLDPNEYLINRKAYGDLKDAGVPVRWYTVDKEKEEKLHAKWTSIDGEKTVIGSANWSHSGLDGGAPGNRTNHEADVLVRDDKTAGVFKQTFMNDWYNHSSAKVPPHMEFK